MNQSPPDLDLDLDRVEAQLSHALTDAERESLRLFWALCFPQIADLISSTRTRSFEAGKAFVKSKFAEWGRECLDQYKKGGLKNG